MLKPRSFLPHTTRVRPASHDCLVSAAPAASCRLGRSQLQERDAPHIKQPVMDLLCTFGYGTVPTRCCHLTHTQPGIGFSVAQHIRAHRIGQSTLAPPALALRSAVHGQRRATRQIARALQSVKESTFEQDVLQVRGCLRMKFSSVHNPALRADRSYACPVLN